MIVDKLSLIKSVSNWQCHLLHFTLTQLWIVLYQPSWKIYDKNGRYILSELLYIFIWCSLFSCISVKGFLILHDCAHNTFFETGWKNQVCGRVFSVLEAVPFNIFKQAHLRHHTVQGDLDKIDPESIHFTTQQIKVIPLCLRELYMIFRFPPLFFGTIPIILWFILWPIASILALDPFPFIGYAVRIFGLSYFSGDPLSYDSLCRSAKINLITGYWAIFMGFLLMHLQHSSNPAYRQTKDTGFNPKTASIEGAVKLKCFTMGIEYHNLHHWETGLSGYKLQYYYYRVKNNKDLNYQLVKNNQTKTFKFDQRLDVKMIGYKKMFRNLLNIAYDEKKSRYLTWWECMKEIYF